MNFLFCKSQKYSALRSWYGIQGMLNEYVEGEISILQQETDLKKNTLVFILLSASCFSVQWRKAHALMLFTL